MSRRLDPRGGSSGPALAILAVFFLGPVLASFALSLTDFDVYAIARPRPALRFVGAGELPGAPRGPRFWLAVRNTAYFVLVGGPLSIAVVARRGAAARRARRPLEAVLPDRVSSCPS